SVASWALLLPITSSGVGESMECLKMLNRFKDSLLKTTTADDRSGILICVALDEGDCIYTEGTINGVFGGCGLAGVDVTLVHPGFFGNVCSIWNLLGAKAIRNFKVSFLVLLGDDVVLETAGWKNEIEVAMYDISAEAGLPEGLACVAFRDLTMPAFPSFPVINSRHVEIFGTLLPPEFVNQGGDPFLFELYRRWGASAFAPTAALKNLLGGKSTARYPKVGVRWQDAILQREIDRFGSLVQPRGARVRCIGVVVPTYRCDHAMRASNLCYFYGIAKIIDRPPWGVTANLCVSGRSQAVWFNAAYPKTGGGEDVDFCLKTRQRFGPNAIVSVPGAVATHPYWSNPIRQVWGWARGDALCLGFHPHATFYRALDWAESIALIWVIWLVARTLGLAQFTAWESLRACGIVGIVDFLEGLAHVFSKSTEATPWAGVLLAPLPRMAQDVARFSTKLAQGNLYQLLLSFDWMDGTDGHKWREASRALHSAKLATNVFIILGTAVGYGMYCSMAGVAIIVAYFKWQAPRARGRIKRQSGPSRFVVLAWQRTGSNLLCGLLHNHSDVFMHNEIFHNRAIHTYHQDRLEEWGWTVACRDANKKAFIKDVFSHSDRPNQAIGFKLFPEHICRDPETMASLLADPTLKKIVLRRDDAVATYLSQRRALLTGQFLHVRQARDVTIRIDPDELQQHLTNYDACFASYVRLLTGQ
ncbi:unnamed protein product, partial [Scytosiphon promiscuus]